MCTKSSFIDISNLFIHKWIISYSKHRLSLRLKFLRDSADEIGGFIRLLPSCKRVIRQPTTLQSANLRLCNLCLSNDECWHWGHVCKSVVLLVERKNLLQFYQKMCTVQYIVIYEWFEISIESFCILPADVQDIAIYKWFEIWIESFCILAALVEDKAIYALLEILIKLYTIKLWRTASRNWQLNPI